MAKKKLNHSNHSLETTRNIKPKKKLGLVIRPALRLPHEDLIRSDQSDLPDQLDQPITPKESNLTQKNSDTTLDNLATVDILSTSPTPLATVDNLTTLDILARVEVKDIPGTLQIPNTIIDSLLPILDPIDSLVYLRLYRLSYGYNTDTCVVGLHKLSKGVNSSERTIQRSIDRLEKLGLIAKLGANFGGKLKGNSYKIYLPNTITKISTLDNLATLDKTATLDILADNKDHDHDLLNNNHLNAHARATMTLYQKITGNPWSNADSKSYKKIAHVPIEHIELSLRQVLSRAPQKPASLAYFVKEILNPTSPNPAHREALKRKYKAILAEIRQLNVGGTARLADIIGALKDRLLTDGLSIDIDLINEALN